MTTNSGVDGQDSSWPDLNGLLAVARSCVRDWRSDEALPETPTDEQLFKTRRVGLPMAAHALNCTQVALNEWDTFPWVAAANARVAFEHAFVAQWLFLTPDGPDHFMRVAKHNNHVHSQEFSRAIADQPDLTAQVSAADLASFHAYAERNTTPGDERSWSLQNLLRELEPSGLFYSSYRALSSAVHPSLGTLSAHYDFDVTPSPQPMSSGDGATDRHEVAQGLALAALWALNASEKWAADYVEPGRAGVIAIPNNLPYDLSHSVRSAQEVTVSIRDDDR